MMTESQFMRVFNPITDGIVQLDEEQAELFNTQHIWTVLDDGGETDNLYASPGFRLVNRLGYLVTMYPWNISTEDALWYEAPTEETEQ